ncbi:IS3 family transposase [Streptomyces sp. DHE7-1]|nr:IS3 family transposase [Streptomyces sp. DHE7-1]
MIHGLASHGVTARHLAALLGVSESGYYAWRARTPLPRALRRAWLTRLILDIHQESGSVYGYRRVMQELGRRYGIDVGHTTVEAVMRGPGSAAGQEGRTNRPRPKAPVRRPALGCRRAGRHHGAGPRVRGRRPRHRLAPSGRLEHRRGSPPHARAPRPDGRRHPRRARRTRRPGGG